MMILISYDIAVSTPKGAKRLRQVAKLCQDYGIRVQNSVFECELEYQTYLLLRKQLCDIIDTKTDSIRFYELGNNFKNHVIHVGAKTTWNFTDTLIL